MDDPRRNTKFSKGEIWIFFIQQKTHWNKFIEYLRDYLKKKKKKKKYIYIYIYSLLIFAFVNTASALIHFEHISHIHRMIMIDKHYKRVFWYLLMGGNNSCALSIVTKQNMKRLRLVTD